MTGFFPSVGHKIAYGGIGFSFAFLMFEFLKQEMWMLAFLSLCGLIFMGLPSTLQRLDYDRRMQFGVPLAGILMLVKLAMFGI